MGLPPFLQHLLRTDQSEGSSAIPFRERNEMPPKSELPLHRPRPRSFPTPPKKPTKAKDFAKNVEFEPEGYKSTWTRRWRNIANRITSASTGSPSDGLGDASASEGSVPLPFKPGEMDKDENDWVVDEVVVSEDPDGPGFHRSDRGTNTGTRRSDTSSMHHPIQESEEDLYTGGVWAWLRWRAWPAVYVFFNPRFEDEAQEVDFQKQFWYSSKPFAFYGALYLVLNWILYLALNRQYTQPSLFAQIAFYGGLTLFTAPVPFMVAFDMPRHWPITFQTWFMAATWYCGLIEVIQMKQCNFFSGINQCHGKDFLFMNFYITALPAMMMFIVSRRLYNAFAQLVIFALLLGLLIPDQRQYARNVVSYAIFSIFIQALHYSREQTERRMFMLNTQLKVAYRAQQKAQIAESKASHAKRRFASYIFHEVRVPLNTAMLAFQNMQANMVFKDVTDQNVEVYALEASLSMMQQVLNDVLDLQKMDAGHFESHPRPFMFHRAIASMLRPVAVASSARHLQLDIDLDPRIDELRIKQQPQSSLNEPRNPQGEDDGLWVVGDELRLRQVLTNLASNAVKFTPDGSGGVKITTRLLEVRERDRAADMEWERAEGEYEMNREKVVGSIDYGARGMNGHGMRPASAHGHGEKKGSFGSGSGAEKRSALGVGAGNGPTTPHQDTLVFRLEVQDNGPGIKPSDLVEGRLFQPFVQTNVGILSGKGSGLGLAIIRQIVSLSGGRLGVYSKKGQGALFWIELAYPIASAEQVRAMRAAKVPVTLSQVSIHPPPPMPSPAISTLGPPTGMPQLPQYQSQDHNLPQFQAPPTPFATAPASTPIMGPMTPPTPVADALSQHAKKAASLPTSPDPNASDPSDALVVLVVDDDPMTRALMTRMLTRQGCIVETAENGQQCLDIVTAPDARKYDLISLDNFMPVMTGEEAVRELRSLGRTDLVVGCTGNALTEDQRSYLEAGADFVLTKPIMIKDFKSVLESARQRRLNPPPDSSDSQGHEQRHVS